VTRLRGMRLHTDDGESNRIPDEALNVALMTTRRLMAWHSGETDAQDSMHLLWEGFCKIRSASGPGFECDETQPSSDNAGTALCYRRVRPSGSRRR
jgi:hypothetical protein